MLFYNVVTAVLVLQFTNDDYRASEPELSLPVRVTKSNRIATPVTVSVTPVTLTQHRASGRPDPRGTLVDNPNSPIEAGIEGCMPWAVLIYNINSTIIIICKNLNYFWGALFFPQDKISAKTMSEKLRKSVNFAILCSFK